MERDLNDFAESLVYMFGASPRSFNFQAHDLYLIMIGAVILIAGLAYAVWWSLRSAYKSRKIKGAPSGLTPEEAHEWVERRGQILESRACCDQTEA